MSTAAGISFDRLCRVAGLPAPVPEYHFALGSGRRWRFDWAWPERLIALEIEGGTFVKGGGRHQRREGFVADCQKYNHAALSGWIVLRVTPAQLDSVATFDLVRRAIELRRGQR